MAVIKKIRIPGYKIIEKENLIPGFHRQNGTFYVFVKQRFTFARLATNRFPSPGIFLVNAGIPEPRRAPAGIFNDTEKCRRKIPRLPILLTPNANEQSNERKNNCTPGHPKRKRYPLSLKLHLIINYLLHVIIA